jgi:hypothetical protein
MGLMKLAKAHNDGILVPCGRPMTQARAWGRICSLPPIDIKLYFQDGFL